MIHIDPPIPFAEQICNLGKNHWSVARLAKLAEQQNLTILTIPLTHLNVYYLYKDITLREMVGHIRQVLDSTTDHSYPIILDEDGELMDGRHRIMRAILDNQETIQAVRFDKNPSPCFRKDTTD